MKTFREIAEMYYDYEPRNDFDDKYRENRINALEKLLTEQLQQHFVIRQSEQLNAFVDFYNNRKLSHERINYDEIDIFLETFNCV